MDRLEEMQTFARVVEAGSISGAAERLGVGKSAVSRRLADLEERLGVQLFRRTTRRLDLTDTGRSFYERCLRILEDVDEAEAAVSEAHGTLRGRLRVAVPLSFGINHLVPAFADFMAAHPELVLDLDFNDRQMDLLAEGFDAAVRIADLADSSLIARRIAPIGHLVCASPAYLARHGTPETPEALADHPCLVYGNAPTPGLWSWTEASGQRRSVRVRPVLQANNGDCLREAAEAGLGIAMEPSFILYRAIEAGRLRPILTGYDWPRLAAHVVYPQTRHLSRRVRALVDFLVDRFAGVPYWDRCVDRARGRLV
ncbi:MAG: LysR family transcriptional regulator [Chromatiales bacterium]|jgi:DNA-binding transcriptional LysR family regulator